MSKAEELYAQYQWYQDQIVRLLDEYNIWNGEETLALADEYIAAQDEVWREIQAL